MKIDDTKHFQDIEDRIVELMGSETKAGFKPTQARDQSGKWTSGGSWHKIDTDEQVKSHIDSYDEEYDMYGSTYDPISGQNLIGQENKFSVGIFTDITGRGDKQVTPGDIEAFLNKNKDLFSQNGHQRGMGTWFSKSDGGLFLDVVEIVDGRDAAEKLAKEHNQIGIYDLGRNEYIEIGGTGKYNLFVMETKKKGSGKLNMKEYGKFMRSVHGLKAPKKDGKKK